MSDSPFNNTFGNNSTSVHTAVQKPANNGTPSTLNQATVPVQKPQAELSAPQPVQATAPAQNTQQASVGMSLPQQKPVHAVIPENKEEKPTTEVMKTKRSRVLPKPIEDLLETAPDAKIEITPNGYRWIIFEGEQGVCDIQESADDFDVLEAQNFKRRHKTLKDVKDMLDFYREYRHAARSNKVDVSPAPPMLNQAVIDSMEIVV